MAPALLSFLLLLSVSSAIDSCPPGTYRARSECVLCPTGTYQNIPGSASCKPCPAGYFNAFPGAPGLDICQPCKAGTFNPSTGATSAAACRPCPRGKDSLKGSERCVSCPKGKIISRCPVGRGLNEFLQPGYCTSWYPGGFVSELAVLKCRDCEPDSFNSRTNAKSCLPCPGTLSSGRGAERCHTCPPGRGRTFYRRGNRVVICSKCLFGDVNDGSDGHCEQCPPGAQANRRRGGTTCVPCPSGTFKEETYGMCKRCTRGQNSDVRGATQCYPDDTPCPTNFFQTKSGACHTCSKRQRYNRRKQTCEPCSHDEESDGALASTCRKCPAGMVGYSGPSQFVTGAASMGCVCKENLVITPGGSCEPCPAGAVKDGIDCKKCPPGTFAPRPGMTECMPCPAGTAQRFPGQTKCTTCPEGLIPGATESLFNPNIGAPRCADPRTFCEPNETRLLVEGDKDFNITLCKGGIRRPCLDGEELYDEGGIRKCLSCRENQVGSMGICRDCQNGTFPQRGRCECISGNRMVKGVCRPCPKGTSGERGAEGCKPCPAGSFSNSIRTEGPCRLCAWGTFSEEGASSCSPCPPGTFTYGHGSANCVRAGSSRD